MEMIAALEIKSSHPVASAIVNHYSGCITDKITNFGAGVGLPDVFDFTSTPGLGLSGQVNGHVVAVGNMQILRQKIAEVSTEADAVYNEWSNGGQTVIFVTIDTKVSLTIQFIPFKATIINSTFNSIYPQMAPGSRGKLQITKNQCLDSDT